jgi:hypothetical protein
LVEVRRIKTKKKKKDNRQTTTRRTDEADGGLVCSDGMLLTVPATHQRHYKEKNIRTAVTNERKHQQRPFKSNIQNEETLQNEKYKTNQQSTISKVKDQSDRRTKKRLYN